VEILQTAPFIGLVILFVAFVSYKRGQYEWVIINSAKQDSTPFGLSDC